MSVQDSAANLIQSCWRNYSQRKKAASRIQASWRGYSVRKFIGSLRDEEKSTIQKICSVCIFKFTPCDLRGQKVVKTPCEHTYHTSCLRNALVKGPAGKKCPGCRAPVSIDIVPMNDLDASLFEAVEEADLPSVLAAIAAGANVDEVDIFGRTSLHNAAEREEVEIVRFLIAANAQLNITDSFDKTPLHDAAQTGAIQSVRVLLAAGASVDSVDDEGDTPLHLTSDIDVLNALVAAGASVAVPDSAGWTPLDCASAREDQLAIEALIAAGA